MKNIILLLIVTVILISCSGKKEQKEVSTTFDLYGTSQVILINSTNDSVHLEIANYPVILGGVEEFDTILNIGDTVKYTLKTPGYSYFTFTVNDVYHKVFTASNAVIIGQLISDSLVNYVGDFDSINNYLAKSSGSYYSTHLTNVELVNLTRNPLLDYDQLLLKVDEIIQKHQHILTTNKAELPNWYFELENKRLSVLGGYQLFNSLSYRKRMLDLDDEIPPHYVDSIVNKIPFKDIRLMGFSTYSRFLFSYTAQSFNPICDTSTSRLGDGFYTYITQLLPVPYNDNALMSHLSMVLQYDRTQIKTEWIELITDTTFKNYLNSERNIEAKLPKGALSPQFSGLTIDSNIIYSTQFTDTVLLVNFWATYCSPCIKNFGFENELALQYRNKPVKIINICIESDFEMFKVFVEIHKLQTVNLFADKKMTTMLKKQFDIYGLPHSILIDKNGMVVKNKCTVRDDGIVDDIEDLLK